MNARLLDRPQFLRKTRQNLKSSNGHIKSLANVVDTLNEFFRANIQIFRCFVYDSTGLLLFFVE